MLKVKLLEYFDRFSNTAFKSENYTLDNLPKKSDHNEHPVSFSKCSSESGTLFKASITLRSSNSIPRGRERGNWVGEGAYINIEGGFFFAKETKK